MPTVVESENLSKRRGLPDSLGTIRQEYRIYTFLPTLKSSNALLRNRRASSRIGFGTGQQTREYDYTGKSSGYHHIATIGIYQL